uniref:Inosine-uridine preferring nucleoside hydrolase-like isoform X1 n=1 Tax=Petromyzon marinus TaxID=7757 RepID=A0AAJ7XFW0_PETMA|nr:inosine-uridine preferring nucleoside hydrolase-like isoform X1 [Petromyzon marinus]
MASGEEAFTRTSPPPAGAVPQKLLVLDVDCGVDDAHALMIALGDAARARVLAVTCCNGNTHVRQVADNVARVLRACGASARVPVFLGASAPLLAKPMHATRFHGNDGLGDSADPPDPSPVAVKKQEEHAVNALVRLAKENPGQITLVAVGPLTNVALATRMDPDFTSRLKELFIMGGTMEAHGNCTMSGEFNFVADPEAAYVVLETCSCPLHIASWEFTVRNAIPWEFYEEWTAADTERGRFVKRISAKSAAFARKSNRGFVEPFVGPGFVPCDAYAVAAALDPDFVTQWAEHSVRVELHGALTRGQMVVDWLGMMQDPPLVKARIMVRCDTARLRAMLVAAVR